MTFTARVSLFFVYKEAKRFLRVVHPGREMNMKKCRTCPKPPPENCKYSTINTAQPGLGPGIRCTNQSSGLFWMFYARHGSLAPEILNLGQKRSKYGWTASIAITLRSKQPPFHEIPLGIVDMLALAGCHIATITQDCVAVCCRV